MEDAVNTRSKQENLSRKATSTTCWQRKSARIDQECRILRGRNGNSSASDDDDEDYEYGGTLKKTGARRRKKRRQSGKNQRAPVRKTLWRWTKKKTSSSGRRSQPRIDLVDIIGEVGNKHVEDTFGVDKRKKRSLIVLLSLHVRIFMMTFTSRGSRLPPKTCLSVFKNQGADAASTY